ncbi:MAG TPA: NUDIX hydrolase [Candidatus Limnocylindrales bacterium]|nr:NUDIX hydrolase [Candidatus Limnocylindrales bacterium]
MEGRRESPWRRHSRDVAYENAWITVWHDDVTRPDGGAGVYGVVHFRSVAVGVVAIDEHDEVTLVGQYRYTLDAWSWEIPEGGVPFGEDPLDGARRELREETGIEAADWREIGRFHLSNSVSDEAAVAYVATGLTTGVASPDETEALDVTRVPFDEALAMTLDGRITDALSVLALQRIGLARLTGEAAGAGASIPTRQAGRTLRGGTLPDD